jgi:hypothetical protein
MRWRGRFSEVIVADHLYDAILDDTSRHDVSRVDPSRSRTRPDPAQVVSAAVVADVGVAGAVAEVAMGRGGGSRSRGPSAGDVTMASDVVGS